MTYGIYFICGFVAGWAIGDLITHYITRKKEGERAS